MPDHSPPEEAVATTAATVLPDPLDYSILGDEEVPWRDLQPWLEQRGYILRPRYRVGWVPKWKGTKISRLDHEDAIELAVSNFALFCKGIDFTGSGQRPHLLDATRVLTEELVMLKRISEVQHPTEIEITRYFSSEPIASHPRNHSIPLYEVLNVPGADNDVILVLPLLVPYDNPPMNSIGEAVEFFRQIFEVGRHYSLLNLVLTYLLGTSIHPPVSHCPQVIHGPLSYISRLTYDPFQGLYELEHHDGSSEYVPKDVSPAFPGCVPRLEGAGKTLHSDPASDKVLCHRLRTFREVQPRGWPSFRLARRRW